MDLYEMFWEIQQNSRIADARLEAMDAARQHREVKATERELQRRVDKLTLVCAAMWDMIKQNHGLPDESLAQAMERIDMIDGERDGRLNPVAECGRCRRRQASYHRQCIYCGQALSGEGPFGTPS